MEGDLSHFIQAVKRIPLFQGLKTEQALALLKISEQRVLEPRAKLVAFGDPSREMFILLSGQLSVRTRDGVQIAIIAPIAPVGEMGIFTGEPRSATVTAIDKAALLVLGKLHLDNLMRRNPDIELAISRNLITTLSERLRHANREIAHLQGLIADTEAGRKQPPDTSAP